MDIQALKYEFEPKIEVVDPLDMPDMLSPYESESGDKEVYEYLLKLEKNRKKLSCLKYMASSPHLTQKEVSENVEVTEKTICQWKSESIFSMLLARELDESWSDSRDEVLRMIYRKAIQEEDLKASELFLRVTA